MILSTEAMISVAENLEVRASYEVCANQLGCSPQTLYLWRRNSIVASKAGDKSSPYYFERPGYGFDWYHSHCAKARANNIMALEAMLRDQARGISEVCFDPQSGRPLLRLNPTYQHLDQAGFDALRDPLTDDPLDPKLRYLYHEDGVTPQLQMKITRQAASLTQAVARATLPQYRETTNVNHEVRGVIMMAQPAPYVPRAQRAQVVDAEFKELPAPERPDIQKLRERAAFLMANPDRASAKQTAPIPPIYGRPISANDKPSREDQADRDRGDMPSSVSVPRTPVAPEPTNQEMDQAPPRASYQRRPAYRDPHRTEFNDSRRGMSSEDDKRRSTHWTTRPRSPQR